MDDFERYMHDQGFTDAARNRIRVAGVLQLIIFLPTWAPSAAVSLTLLSFGRAALWAKSWIDRVPVYMGPAAKQLAEYDRRWVAAARKWRAAK